jgi:adenine phosphoribosyltransferase
MDLAQYIRDIPDFPKPGILFKDITPLLAEPRAFQYAIDRMTEHYRGRPIDAIAAAEARGFLFAAPLALALVLATGGTMEAGCQLIEKAGGQVAGCAFLVELTFLHGRDRLRGHEVFSLIHY